ncbi:GNAT family N-acetyltransferase [Panacibacter ginsenosidivorans]|uniref:GNAT family N-acetyltransferase n=2 Tax=Panacibacter ginsenosidivorans TaxID=1813871 RepID=A0A5B8VGG5_9BACT|nr:GNAT family N-acetyltransferase [Panacibacter ginsenosidivorans]
MITIRKSAETDIPSIFLLIKEFSTFQKTPEKFFITPEQMQADKDLFNCFIAEDTTSNNIVGYACFSIIYYSWSGKSLYLDDLFVKENYRGQNIGSLLMNAVIEFAKENNCKKMRWQVSKWNAHAQTFYKKLGAVIDDVEINCDLVF